jgi:hypothetical protein
MCDAEDVLLKLLNSHNEETTLDDISEACKQIVPDDNKKPEPGPKERTVTVLKLTKWTH